MLLTPVQLVRQLEATYHVLFYSYFIFIDWVMLTQLSWNSAVFFSHFLPSQYDQHTVCHLKTYTCSC